MVDGPYPFEPDWVVHPGAMLEEWLYDTGLPRQVASLHGLDIPLLEEIIAGDTLIDEDIAEKLSNLTMIPANMWLTMEHNFRAGLAAGLTWTR